MPRAVKRRPAEDLPVRNYLSRSTKYGRHAVTGLPSGRHQLAPGSLESYRQLAIQRDCDRVVVDPRRRRHLALLIAAHDEALVLAATINSAIAAGQKPENIYVVDDNSADATLKVAESIIGSVNVCRVRRSGKGLALTKGAKKFCLSQRYRWIHIADADGGFDRNYFRVMRRELRAANAAATGYVRSLPGGMPGKFRVFEYTIGMEVHRRFQAMTGTINVIPGPTSVFRYDVFERVNFNNKSLTEDLDVTLQIHRQNLGRIQFIPQAVALTQDPRTLHDYIRQITRWNRGVMQSMVRHKIGLRPHRLDAYMSYQVAQNLIMLFNYCALLPVLAWERHNITVLALTFLIDVALTFWLTFLVAIWSRRLDIIPAFPQIYSYRWVSLAVFVKAFVEVVLLRKFLATDKPNWWETASRRYLTS